MLTSDRRTVLKAAGAVATGGSVAAGCDLLATEPEGEHSNHSDHESRPQAPEAPQLARQVKEGKLPALKDRLPKKPMVVRPVERIGRYGGTWRTAVTGPDSPWVYYTIGYENLVRWVPDWTGAAGEKEINPNIARKFTTSADKKTITFHLRPGMRWSDGHPFTAHDIAFAQNAVLSNRAIYPAQDENAPTANVVDDHTVALTFAQPDALFLRRQCGPDGADLVTKPEHYLRRFHREHNRNVDQLANAQGFNDWKELFAAKADWQNNTELPTLNPWIITETADSGQLNAERNPYFWKTDPEGNQLPYIDRVTYKVINDIELMLTRALHGDIDMHVRDFNTFVNKPVLAKNADRGGYRFFEAVRTTANNMIIGLNLTHKDPIKREIFQNKDFRIGLSLALDRNEIIDTTLQRQGDPWQQAPGRGSPFYDKTMARQFTTHRTAKANWHLDKAGYTKKNSDGVRLGPDGRPISFSVEVPTDFDPSWLDIMQMVVKEWSAIGVDARVKTESRELYSQRVTANSHDAGVWRGNGGMDILLVPDEYFPRSNGPGSVFATQWGNWYQTDGQQGEKPPAQARRQMQLYDQITAATDENKQAQLLQELLTIAEDEFWSIGTALSAKQYGIVKKNFRNVPESMPYGSTYPTPGPTNPEQYFFSS